MSDNTPTDGTKNTETDAATAPDLNATAEDSADQSGVPAHAAEESATAVAPKPVQEPIVIDYDAINANLSAAERDDAEAQAAAARNLSPRSTAAPVAATDADASSLTEDYADDYADSAAPINTGPADTGPAETDTSSYAPADSEPVVPVVPVALVVGAAAPTEPPVDYAAVAAPRDAPADPPAAVAPVYTPPAQSPIYVQAPTKPKDKSNRGGGIMIALLATVVFAVLYAIAAFIIIGVTSSTIAVTLTGFSAFAALPVFYIPIIFFFLTYSALIAVINRGGWWAHVLFGFLVAVVVYFSYIGGAMLGLVFDGRADGLNPAELGRIVSTLWLNPGAIAAGLIAREVPIWFGAWIARRGRQVTARNAEARTEYERLLADGPQVTRS